MGVRLFVGGHGAMVQGERIDLAGDRMYTAAHAPRKAHGDNGAPCALLDSGAFTDPPHKRLTPEQALDRQLAWEARASESWGFPFHAYGLVSYDLLIDETWVAGERHKRRWTIKRGEWAVSETIQAAHYLASQRKRLAPRKLILSAQGVDAMQYAECAVEVLKVTRPGDWFGLGGWCILGGHTSWMPAFWQTLYSVLPLVRAAGVKHVHIFGVLYQPALGGLLWLADQYGLTVSTDSSAPIMACTWKDDRRRYRRPYWRDNVKWWIDTLANLRTSHHYKAPPDMPPARQLVLIEEVA